MPKYRTINRILASKSFYDWRSTHRRYHNKASSQITIPVPGVKSRKIVGDGFICILICDWGQRGTSLSYCLRVNRTCDGRTIVRFYIRKNRIARYNFEMSTPLYAHSFPIWIFPTRGCLATFIDAQKHTQIRIELQENRPRYNCRVFARWVRFSCCSTSMR